MKVVNIQFDLIKILPTPFSIFETGSLRDLSANVLVLKINPGKSQNPMSFVKQFLRQFQKNQPKMLLKDFATNLDGQNFKFVYGSHGGEIYLSFQSCEKLQNLGKLKMALFKVHYSYAYLPGYEHLIGFK